MPEPIIRPGVYLVVYGILVVLTIVTVAISFLHLGLWHVLAGLLIATAKAILVALFFMHVLHSSRLTWAVVLSGVFWMGILVSLTLSDYLTRGWLAY